jgi:hypothetical protein
MPAKSFKEIKPACPEALSENAIRLVPGWCMSMRSRLALAPWFANFGITASRSRG